MISRYSLVGVALFLTSVTGAFPGAPRGGVPEDEALVRGHQVEEERKLKPSSAKVPGEALHRSSIAKVRKERQLRSKELTSTVNEIGGFLERFSSVVLQEGRDLAKDKERLKQVLVRGPSLPQLLAVVPHTSADILKARRSWEATIRQFDQASFLEDLIARYRAFVRDLDPGVGPGGHRESPERIFYFPSALALRGELVRWAVEKERLVYLQALRHGLSVVAHDYQAAWYSARGVDLLQESRELFRDVETITQTQLQVGKVSQSDSYKAQSAIAVLETRLVAVVQEGVAARARINTWLGIPADTPWGPLQEPFFDPDLPGLPVLWERARKRRQELGQVRAALETAKTLLRLAETNLYPRGASGSAMIALGRGAEAGPGRDAEATFPSRPQPGVGGADFGSGAAWIDELRLRVLEAESAYEAEKAMTLRGLTDTLAKLEASAVLRDTYRGTVVPKARLSVETLRSRYIGGQTPFIEFLDAARTALDSSIEEVKATRENWNDMVDLMEWTGGSIAEILRAAAPSPTAVSTPETR